MGAAEDASASTFKAEIRHLNGAATVFVNGAAYHFGAVAVACYRPERPSLLGASPRSICLIQPPESQAVGERLDLESLGRRFETLGKEFPDALFGCIFSLAPSLTWVKRHPEQMTGYDLPVDWLAPRPSGRLPEPSWASAQWQKDSAEALGTIAAFLHREFAGRVILYQFGAGHCGENFPCMDPVTHGQWYCGDFSEPMVQWFRRWLRDRYGGDRARLRGAWSDADVDFETAQIPDRLARLRSDWFSFRSPRRARVSDYHRAWSASVEQCILGWAQAVKQATNGESLTASPLGSVLDCGLNADTIQHQMKNTFRRCLESPHLDMLQSPASYVLRDPGRGDTSAMIPLGSLALKGKIWLRDFDSRTSLVGGDRERDPSSVLWQAPETPWQDEQLLKRDAGYSLLKGGAWWWHEIVPGMYGHAAHARLAGEIERVGPVALHADRRPIPGLAVLTDPASNFHLSNSNRLIFAMNYEARRLHWTHAGLASEVYCVEDVGDSKMPAHKVIMVTNAFEISDERVGQIKELAKANAATLIWLVAPGVVADGGFDTDRTSRIVGLPIKAVDAEAQPTIRMIEANHPWSTVQTADGQRLKTFGAGPRGKDDSGGRAVGPLFYADVESSADVCELGLDEALALPGLVVHKQDDLTTVFCSAPYVHHALLHAIGRDAGAPMIAPCGDLIHASRELILLQAVSQGGRTIHLPQRAEVVFDLFAGELLAQGADHVALTMERLETRLLFAGPREKLDVLNPKAAPATL